MKNAMVRSVSTFEQGDCWPETVYRYVEHYKFEPQHLCSGQSTKTFRDKIRKQEPPLNFLLNMLFVALPETWMTAVMGAFTLSRVSTLPTGLMQRFPVEINQCQPDIRLESDTHRVFVECKINAYSDLTQILKYLLLSAHLDQEEAPRTPWMLYLTPGPMAKHWNPVADRSYLTSGGVEALHDLLQTADLTLLGSGRMAKTFLKAIGSLRAAAVLGHATWQEFGDRLRACASIESPSDLEKPLCRIAKDFLSDLERRALWAPR